MKLVKDLQKWIDGYNEVKTLADELELAFDFYKEELVTEEDVDTAYAKAREAVEALELKNMLRDEADQMDCVLKINSGAGGTESQDWASMLMRMYLRYAETNGYKATIANLQEGDEAGIKTCTINIEGDFAYGYLKGENGVHRLVRVSPYNAQGKRMTSFASVFVNFLVLLAMTANARYNSASRRANTTIRKPYIGIRKNIPEGIGSMYLISLAAKIAMHTVIFEGNKFSIEEVVDWIIKKRGVCLSISIMQMHLKII